MRKAAIRSVVLAAAAVFFANVPNASAGVDSIRAEAYFNAIAGGNPETITSFYADNAEFHWIGGPLAGVYKGKKEIRQLWEKFTKSAGDIKHDVLELSESLNGKVSTVTARVNLIGPKEVPVKFIMMFQEGKIVSEIWQVDKPVTALAAEIGKPEQYLDNQAGSAEAEQTPEQPQNNIAAAAPAEDATQPPEAAVAPPASVEPQEQEAIAEPQEPETIAEPQAQSAAEPAQAEAVQQAEQTAPVEAEPAQKAEQTAPVEAEQQDQAENDANQQDVENSSIAESDYKPEADRKKAEPTAEEPRLAAIPALPVRKAEEDYVAKPKRVKKRAARQRSRERARRYYDDHRSWRHRAYGYDDTYDDEYLDDYYDNYRYRRYRRYRDYYGGY